VSPSPGAPTAPARPARPVTRATATAPPERVDVAVVGAGIVGLATALRCSSQADLRVAVLEREDHVAAHQTGHNSGVVHAGLYYAPGSAKAVLCREGKALLERYCEARGIPLEHPGKLVVALDAGDLEPLRALRERGLANGVEGLEEVGPERIREIEPHVAGIRRWGPRTDRRLHAGGRGVRSRLRDAGDGQPAVACRPSAAAGSGPSSVYARRRRASSVVAARPVGRPSPR
jgi:glycine/D-amino acid oxidase-like deaminating enzyme